MPRHISPPILVFDPSWAECYLTSTRPLPYLHRLGCCSACCLLCSAGKMVYQESELRDTSPTQYNDYEQHMSPGQYVASRIPTLRPPMNRAPNPISLLRQLNTQQWLFFLVAFLAWSWDAFDFFTVSLTVDQLAEQFHKSPAQITWGITLVLMFRSVGSTIFGK